ncbi:hypothetical protein HL657_01770 [Methanoculleus sp. YWC-01]|uniref:Uncharacterized protein n=1 Tax=Methanoculleus nereidis TaxID=2735141 RepID=A0ABU3YZH5_9EURY|nr:hypothetical protein [Methanoculleus sp. YWC-01]MDV4341926.1 hypothetical protein [Methanoculleus sp. YWC-01]
MEERRFISGIGRRGLISVALLLFILAGSGIACASPGGEPPADAGEGREAVLAEPGDTTTYHGSESASTTFYNPVLLGCALGAVIVLAVGYFLTRRSRGKDAP